MSELVELIAATSWFWTFSIGFLVSIAAAIVILFFSSLWWLFVFYLVLIWIDRDTSETGGRSIQWVRELFWWKLVKNYFKFNLVTDGDIELDKGKNYLFACFPHGMYPVGPSSAFINGYQEKFPHHRAFTTALNIQFWMPWIRELFLAIGAVSVSAPSLKFLLGDERGGNILSILIGGGDEAKYSKPGKYKIILNKRKGFIKMALQTGSPIVPVFTFGETDVFDQLDFPGFNTVRNIVKNTTGIGLVIPVGRYLICPNPVPLTTVVGKPINVSKVDNPSPEEIDDVHQKFVSSIKDLFDNYKGKYVSNPEKTVLEIV